MGSAARRLRPGNGRRTASTSRGRAFRPVAAASAATGWPGAPASIGRMPGAAICGSRRRASEDPVGEHADG